MREREKKRNSSSSQDVQHLTVTAAEQAEDTEGKKIISDILEDIFSKTRDRRCQTEEAYECHSGSIIKHPQPDTVS